MWSRNPLTSYKSCNMEPMSQVKVTTEVLLKGALLFAIIDAVFVTILARIIKPETLHKMKWRLVIIMVIFFAALFGTLVSVVFWDPVYHLVFPVWARWIIPPFCGILFASFGLFAWWLSFRLNTNAVLNFCLLGGLWGIITHIWAVYRGILEKPPMLQGANPIAAVVIATFEFIFYWCVCLSISRLSLQIGKKFEFWSSQPRR